MQELTLVIGGTGKTGRRVAKRLKAQGRLVLLSGRGEAEAQRAEDALKASGADWTILRCSWFMQNFSEGYLLDPVLSGEVALPVGDMPEPFVDAEDIAEVAATALTEDGHAGQLYELTGPRALTFADATQLIARACSRKIAFLPVPIDAYATAAAEHGVPTDLVALLRYLFAEVLDGRNVQPADGVQRALGRPARDFAQFARQTAASGAWSEA